jgi:hypothetical protein
MGIAAPEQQSNSLEVALILDAIVGRLSYDEEFVEAIARDPRAAFAEAGIRLVKEDVEEFIKSNPERFDKVFNALCENVDPHFLASVTEPSCGPHG